MKTALYKMKKSLLETIMSKFYHVETTERIRFETHRRREREATPVSKYYGCVDGYVWFITPLDGIDFSKSRINSIKTEINDIHIPLLENDEKGGIESVTSYYRRQRIYRFGKLIVDRVHILPAVPVYKK